MGTDRTPTRKDLRDHHGRRAIRSNPDHEALRVLTAARLSEVYQYPIDVLKHPRTGTR
ncbi:hypothetical protein [Phytohabitans suffuscus]|nr:hypothetical protein [Phytohabitans suffuscus]